MISILTAFLMSVGVAAIVLISVLVGGWLVFKSKAAPGEGFLTSPKGEVFRVKDIDAVPDNPDNPTEDEQHILERTNKFMSMLGGGQ